MTDMKRLLNELEELREENIVLRNKKTELELENVKLKTECSKLHAQMKNEKIE